MITENNYQEVDLGNISFNPRGNYSDTDSYEYLDLVFFEGGSYLCKFSNLTGVSPISGISNDYWQCVSIPGDITPEYQEMYRNAMDASESAIETKNEIVLIKQEVTNAASSVEEKSDHVDQVAAKFEGDIEALRTNPSVFVITFTKNSNGEYDSSDKDFEDILAAYNLGKSLVAVSTGSYFNLEYSDNSCFVFYKIEMTESSFYKHNVSINSDNTYHNEIIKFDTKFILASEYTLIHPNNITNYNNHIILCVDSMENIDIQINESTNSHVILDLATFGRVFYVESSTQDSATLISFTTNKKAILTYASDASTIEIVDVYQTIHDDSLNTTSKEIPSAINEVNTNLQDLNKEVNNLKNLPTIDEYGVLIL